MKKKQSYYCVIGLLLFFTPAYSQKNIEGLIKAEKAFAAYTVSHTIKDGFLVFMDAEGIIFRRGNAINGIDAFLKQKPGPSILDWQPAFALISAAGDLGVTTGPFQFRSGAAKDTSVSYGNFSSIWRVNRQGEWKNLVDLGVSYAVKLPALAIQKIELKLRNNNLETQDELLRLDRQFNTAVKEKNSRLTLSQLAKDGWLNVENHTPVREKATINHALMSIPDSISLTPITGNISSSRDLCYVYGSSLANGVKKENYLRVWIRLNGQWQVAMQTIKW